MLDPDFDQQVLSGVIVVPIVRPQVDVDDVVVVVFGRQDGAEDGGSADVIVDTRPVGVHH